MIPINKTYWKIYVIQDKYMGIKYGELIYGVKGSEGTASLMGIRQNLHILILTICPNPPKIFILLLLFSYLFSYNLSFTFFFLSFRFPRGWMSLPTAAMMLPPEYIIWSALWINFPQWGLMLCLINYSTFCTYQWWWVVRTDFSLTPSSFTAVKTYNIGNVIEV